LCAYKFNLKSKKVTFVKTKHRKIVTDIPPPETIELIKILSKYEPPSMLNELPVLWNNAKGYNVFDSSGNCWIDFSSGIFVANVGHSHTEVRKSIINIINKPLLHNYYFPSEIRAKLVKKIIEKLPLNLDTVFLLTTGSEAIECALKITRIYGRKINEKKIGIISFEGAIHGKTLGALMLGGKATEKHWIGNHDPNIHHIPFPYSYTCPWKENEFHVCDESCFKKSLEKLQEKTNLTTIAGIMMESFQGWGAIFYPKDYVKAVKNWAVENNALLIFDEMQGGFGRTGRFFAFEHYGVQPDIICCGKGISSSLPLSAVIARRELFDDDPSLNSTHGGNPLCCAATLANLEIIDKENLVNESARKGIILEEELQKIKSKYPIFIHDISGKGLVFAVHIINPNTKELDVDLADKILERSMEKGLLMIRTGMGTLKIGPPLIIPDDALKEGISVLDEAIGEIINEEN